MGETAVEQRSPAEIRRDIDATRSDLSANIDEIEDRVSPRRMVDRSQQRLRTRWYRTREAVMGTAQHSRDRLAHSGEAAGQRMDQAQDSLEQSVQGNPLAAGLIAFGLGALASSLLPSSRTEQRLASTMRETAEPVVRDELQRTGQEVGQHLADEAKQAAQDTMQTAKDAAQSTVDSAKEAAQTTGEHAKEAARATGEQAKDAAQQTREAAGETGDTGTTSAPGLHDTGVRPPTTPPTHGTNM